MFKLIAFFAILAAAFAVPAPEPNPNPKANPLYSLLSPGLYTGYQPIQPLAYSSLDYNYYPYASGYYYPYTSYPYGYRKLY